MHSWYMHVLSGHGSCTTSNLYHFNNYIPQRATRRCLLCTYIVEPIWDQILAGYVLCRTVFLYIGAKGVPVGGGDRAISATGPSKLPVALLPRCTC